jgi:hypothetical protein
MLATRALLVRAVWVTAVAQKGKTIASTHLIVTQTQRLAKMARDLGDAVTHPQAPRAPPARRCGVCQVVCGIDHRQPPAYNNKLDCF